MIAIADYGAGNIRSVLNALDYFGVQSSLAQRGNGLRGARGIILPGVGEFGSAMAQLDKCDLSGAIREAAASGVPVLGICLGLQLLLNSSEESPTAKGLGLIKGRVSKLKAAGKKLPHIGWSSIYGVRGRLLDGIAENDFFYFVHSYGAHCDDENSAAAKADYSQSFDACVEKDNIFACQFHPEKSGVKGLKILSNFLSICGEKASAGAAV